MYRDYMSVGRLRMAIYCRYVISAAVFKDQREICGDVGRASSRGIWSWWSMVQLGVITLQLPDNGFFPFTSRIFVSSFYGLGQALKVGF